MGHFELIIQPQPNKALQEYMHIDTMELIQKELVTISWGVHGRAVSYI